MSIMVLILLFFVRRIQRNVLVSLAGDYKGDGAIYARGVQRGSSPLGREGRSTIGMLRLSLWGRIQRNRAVSWQGDLRGTEFLLQRESRGEAPRWLEESKETWVSWRGYPKGAGAPLAHDLACKV